MQDENRKEIFGLPNEFNSIYLNDNRYKLLKYIDPYGDTFFNNLQMADLIDDLNQLKQLDNNSLIDEIIGLAHKCEDSIHTYLAFYGD